jgi:hypothetical protein
MMAPLSTTGTLVNTDATTQTIFTINARGNSLLSNIQSIFGLNGKQMSDEIWRHYEETVEILAGKGINYLDLKCGLVPTTKKHEAAFIFDTSHIESLVYGSECMEKILPLLESEATLSVLVGDLLATQESAIHIVNLLFREIVQANQPNLPTHPTVFFAIYVNNLSELRLKRIHEGLLDYRPYMGFVPTTYSSAFKSYLSLILANLFIKRKRTIILPHEDDRDNEENINITPYPLEKFGYQVRSLQGLHFGVFLDYKIERPVLPHFEDDTTFSLNALSHAVIPLDGLRVFIEDAKYEYLVNNKLKRTSLMSLGKEGLEKLIEEKIRQSYIYQLRIRPTHQVSTFTIMLEAEHDNRGYPFRIEVSLEYAPENGILRVVTMM